MTENTVSEILEILERIQADLEEFKRESTAQFDSIDHRLSAVESRLKELEKSLDKAKQ